MGRRALAPMLALSIPFRYLSVRLSSGKCLLCRHGPHARAGRPDHNHLPADSSVSPATRRLLDGADGLAAGHRICRLLASSCSKSAPCGRTTTGCIAHIVLALAGCGILFADWAGRRGWLSPGFAAALPCDTPSLFLLLAGLGGAGYYARNSRWLNHARIQNPADAPGNHE